MPGIPGSGKRGKQQPQRKKSKSGNPAKRAAEERAAAEKAAAGRAASAASAFGAPGSNGQGADADPMAGFDPSNLPKGFEKFLGKG
jgi:signal recognition particle subunit SRP54